MSTAEAESAAAARAAYSAKTQAKIAEYAAEWADKPNMEAARHFEVGPRTIGRWRVLLQLPDGRTVRWQR